MVFDSIVSASCCLIGCFCADFKQTTSKRGPVAGQQKSRTLDHCLTLLRRSSQNLLITCKDEEASGRIVKTQSTRAQFTYVISKHVETGWFTEHLLNGIGFKQHRFSGGGNTIPRPKTKIKQFYTKKSIKRRGRRSPAAPFFGFFGLFSCWRLDFRRFGCIVINPL